MPTAKQNAINLYMEGIQNGNPREAVAAYTGDRYTQHSTGVADGAEGFITFFETFLEHNPVRDFQVVRALQDGSHVFVQVYQNINNGEAEWLTTDFFASDSEGRIVEHWDVIAPVKSDNPSNRGQFDGPSEITDLDKTASNKALVLDFINSCLIGRDFARVTEFINAEHYIQHNADIGDGLSSFLEHFAPDDCPLRYQSCFLCVAEGNFVATLNRATWDHQALCQVDLFRIADGKIVEHWDNSEPVPPQEEWANSGKF